MEFLALNTGSIVHFIDEFNNHLAALVSEVTDRSVGTINAIVFTTIDSEWEPATGMIPIIGILYDPTMTTPGTWHVIEAVFPS